MLGALSFRLPLAKGWDEESLTRDRFVSGCDFSRADKTFFYQATGLEPLFLDVEVFPCETTSCYTPCLHLSSVRYRYVRR